MADVDIFFEYKNDILKEIENKRKFYEANKHLYENSAKKELALLEAAKDKIEKWSAKQ